MTSLEIARAYREFVLQVDSEHTTEILKKIGEHSDLKKFTDSMYDLRKKFRSHNED
jgi:hypothetical protein